MIHRFDLGGGQLGAEDSTDSDLKIVIPALRGDYEQLGARIRELTNTIDCDCKGVTIRVHYPAFREGKSTVREMVEVISLYLAQFSLPRTEIAAVDSLYGNVPAAEFRLKANQLQQRANGLFIRAQKATNRNGEAGELLLYLLTEWKLGAPQLLAKMSLKTNKNMPVHGADGIHVKIDESTGDPIFYFGESKLYADVAAGVSEAIASIAEAMTDEKMAFELGLVQTHISLSGLNSSARAKLLEYLDPFDEASNKRRVVTTCLVGFDSDAYTGVADEFDSLIAKKVAEVSTKFAKGLVDKSLGAHVVELFLFPVPSVGDLRDFFQERIGWKEAKSGSTAEA